MEIFYKDGPHKDFLNIPLLLNQGVYHILMTGARGIGKTFGVVEDCIINNPRQFIYMRRTPAELEAIYKSEGINPFKGFNRFYKRNLGLMQTSRYTGIITEREVNEDGKLIPVGEPLGICLALKSIAKIRGFDGSDYDTVFYDEFIPENHVEKIRDECTAFLNALETMGRNRELIGMGAQQIILASNANKLDNEIYLGLGLVTRVERMQRKGQIVSLLKNRDILLINIPNSPVSERKSETTLYKFAQGTAFSDMSLHNKFLDSEESAQIRSRPLAEYNPVFAVGEICVYQHKTLDEFYCCSKVSGTPPRYGVGEVELKRVKHDYRWIVLAYMDNAIIFESRTCELLFRRYLQC